MMCVELFGEQKLNKEDRRENQKNVPTMRYRRGWKGVG